MTVLEERIKHFEANIAGLWVNKQENNLTKKEYDWITIQRATLAQVVIELKESLPAEEQQIRDAWKAAITWDEFSGSPVDDFVPDLETYIKSLKQGITTNK